MQPESARVGRIEAVLCVTAMIACALVTVSMLFGYSTCGFGSLVWLVYATELTLGGVFWLPGTLFGLLMHASTRANSRQWGRVTLCVILATFVICAGEVAVFHSGRRDICAL